MARRQDAPSTGAPLLFRDHRHASKFWGLSSQENQILGRVPRPKHQFYAAFKLAQPIQNLPLIKSELTDPYQGIGFKVRSFDNPSVNPTIETKNQYNKKRIVQTGLDYEPVNVTFWDTVDDTVLKLWAQYYQFYFGDGRKETPSSWDYDVTYGEFNKNSFGFTPPIATPNTSDFFSVIELYHFYGNGRFNQIDLVRPKIQSFQHDSNDYETSEPISITMQFAYEGIIYTFKNGLITDYPDKAELLGIKEGNEATNDYYSPQSAESVARPGSSGNFSGVAASVPMGGTDVTSNLPGIVKRGLPAEEDQGFFGRAGDFISETADSALGAFGNFDFGGAAESVINQGTDTLLDTAANFGNQAINTAISGGDLRDVAKQAGISAVQGFSTGIGGQALDAASSIAQAAGASPDLANTLASTATRQLNSTVGNVLRGGDASAGVDQFLRANAQTALQDGLRLSREYLKGLNQTKPASTQVGQNRSARRQAEQPVPQGVAGNVPMNQTNTDRSLLAELGDSVGDVVNNPSPEGFVSDDTTEIRRRSNSRSEGGDLDSLL